MIDASEFAGRTCLVTGAGRGLGRATASRLAAGGATVLLCDKDIDAAKSVAEDLGGDRTHAIACNVADADAVSDLHTVLARDFSVDVLINNAGYYHGRSFAEITADEWDLVISVNLKSVFLMTRAFMHDMAARGYGRIVNIASSDAYIAKPTNCHYAAAKAGVVSLTKSFAQELAPTGVLVNGVSPAAIATDTAKSQSWFAKRTPQIPTGGAAEPADIAEVIAFLASSRNRFMAGETVIASGGLVMV